MKVELYIREYRNCFIGETPSICINTNIAELKGEPVLFYGDTKQSVIDQVVAVLKAKKLFGFIRLV